MRKKPPRGQAIIELIASVIILSLLFAFTANLSAYLYVTHVFISAAREGVRTASLNRDLAGANVSGAQSKVIAVVKNYIQNASGVTVADSDIVVTPPDAALVAGDRQVKVVVSHTLTMPLNVAGLMTALGGSGTGLDEVPISAAAIMRYEE